MLQLYHRDPPHKVCDLGDPGRGFASLEGMRRALTWFGTLGATLLLAFAGTAFSTTAAHADTEDFSFDRWEAHYELSLDDEGRAVAKVTETIVARFPDFPQNRGIVRGIPIRYEGAPAYPEDITVTDLSGSPLPFETDDTDRFRIIGTGNDEFVFGEQAYVISYTIHDVILAASETEVDEFYWDVLPFDRAQDVGEFSATVTFSDELAARLTGSEACYAGPAHVTDQCEITADGAEITVPSMPVAAKAGVTIAIGLEPGTVVQPPERSPNFALDTLPVVLSGAGAVTAITGAGMAGNMIRKRRTHRGVIVAQYDVPKSLPPLIAAPIAGTSPSPVAAEFVHLAVNGVMRIEEAEPEGGLFGSNKKRRFFRLFNAGNASDQLDKMMVHELFKSTDKDTLFELPRKSDKFASRMQVHVASGVSEALNRGYFTREQSSRGRWFGLIGIVLTLPALALILLGTSREPGPGLFASIVLMGLALVAAIISVLPHRVYTPLGAETREYLLGVREFIRVAEADRIKMLQSYSGAERREDGTVNVIHLYEKLLPYAMLFGLEKEWGRALETQYAQAGYGGPGWYPALALRSTDLGTSLSSFASTLSTAASYSSSSSGGSTGGGSVGGGGGGGFAGGR